MEFGQQNKSCLPNISYEINHNTKNITIYNTIFFIPFFWLWFKKLALSCQEVDVVSCFPCNVMRDKIKET